MYIYLYIDVSIINPSIDKLNIKRFNTFKLALDIPTSAMLFIKKHTNIYIYTHIYTITQLLDIM